MKRRSGSKEIELSWEILLKHHIGCHALALTLNPIREKAQYKLYKPELLVANRRYVVCMDATGWSRTRTIRLILLLWLVRMAWTYITVSLTSVVQEVVVLCLIAVDNCFVYQVEVQERNKEWTT